MGRKQSSFLPASTPLAGTEIVDVIQGGKNRRSTVAAVIAAALQRANHLGTQAIATVSGLQAALDAKAAQTALDTEAATRSGADTALTTAVGTNTSAIAAEATARAAADATLTTNVATNTSAIATETTRATTAEGLKLAKASNLSDVANAATALANLGGAPTVQTFYVDNYLPASPTAVQTMTAAQAAQDAAEAVGGVCKFTPGKTYTVSSCLKVGSATTIDFSGATIKKAAADTNTNPLLTNKSWAAGNPDIKLICHGATFDYDGASGHTAAGFSPLGECIHLQNVPRLKMIGRPTIKRALKFALIIGNADDIEVDGAHFYTFSDGFHGYGPMRRAKFGDFTGTTGDDFFALTISDYAAQVNNLTANGETTLLGDFEDITVRSLTIDNTAIPTGGASTGSGLSILGNSSTYKARRIHVGTITGAGVKACRIENDGGGLPNCNVEDVTIGKVSWAAGTSGVPVRLSPTSMDSFTIGELTTLDGGNTSLIHVAGGTVKTIRVNGLTNLASPTAGLILVDTTAVVNSLFLRGVKVILGASGRLVQQNSTTAMFVSVDAFDISGASTGYIVHQAAGAGALTVAIGRGQVKTVSTATGVFNATATVLIDGATFDTNVQFISCGNAASVVRVVVGSIRQVAAGDRSIAKVASSTFSANGPVYRVDLSKVDTAAAVAGDVVYNTNSGAGAGIGLNLWDGTAWKLLGASINNSFLTAKGSLITASAASTPAELTTSGVTTGYVLTKQGDGSVAWSAGTPGPTGPAPNARPRHVGRYSLASKGPAAASIMTTNRMYLVPWDVEVAGNTDLISCYVTIAAGTGGLLRFGWYPDDGTNQPDLASVTDYGTTSSVVTNGFADLAISTAVTVGRRWLAVCSQGSPSPQPTIYMVGTAAAEPHVPMIAATDLLVSGYYVAAVSGALPTSGTLVDIVPSPIIRVRAAA